MSEPAPCPFRAADFRQHPAMEFASPHWLRAAVYGRHLLKLKLRQLRPDLAVTLVRAQPQYEGLLEAMVDVLELRDWPCPRTPLQRLHATRAILRLGWSLDAARDTRQEPPGPADPLARRGASAGPNGGQCGAVAHRGGPAQR